MNNLSGGGGGGGGWLLFLSTSCSQNHEEEKFNQDIYNLRGFFLFFFGLHLNILLTWNMIKVY